MDQQQIGQVVENLFLHSGLQFEPWDDQKKRTTRWESQQQY